VGLEIGVFIDSKGKTIALNQSGTTQVYIKEKGKWRVTKEITCKIDELMSLSTIRDNINSMAKSLGNCRVIVASEVKGISYTILDGLGFNIWELDGAPEDFLDDVANSEEKEKLDKSMIDEVPTPIKNSDDNYFIDLKIQMKNNSKFSSKQMLLPFLHNTKFNKLEILCGHVPPWFEDEFKKLNLSLAVEEAGANTLKVTVFPK